MKIFGYKLHRLKIVEQIAIVFFFSVLIPMAISGVIINNINQHSVRHQLKENAALIANMVSDEIDFFYEQNKNTLNQIAYALEYLPTQAQKVDFFNTVKKEYPGLENIETVKYQNELDKLITESREVKKATVYHKLNSGNYLVVTYNMEGAQKRLFQSLQGDTRQIYVLSGDDSLLASHNYSESSFNEVMKQLPKYRVYDEAKFFGDVKNEPKVYVKKKDPELTIVVNTPEKLARDTIYDNRFKIILSVLAAMFSILFVTAVYTFYLYINIRQLIKGIMAISSGNFSRQIRLLKTAYTPYEVVFIAKEFNKMASDINKSYMLLKKNNVELKELNEFRSNLIDTVSHELRTPLTSIQGYTSRLLRQDIKIDEETKQKSLRIIKEQSEKLQRLIEDLLTIPDIENMRLKTVNEPVSLYEVLERSEMLLRKKDGHEIIINISDDFPLIFADKGRLEQVFVNLLENAVKYAYPDTIISVDTKLIDEKAVIAVKNQCDVIAKEKLQKLFDKFVRLEDNTTRTTRGTGLGLFIVKGLVEAMNGTIELSSNDDCGFCAEVTINLAGDENADA